jgi:ubiquinone biosynthesis protein
VIREAFRDLNRLREIAAVVARHGFGSLLDRARLPETIGRRVDAEVRPEVARKSTAARFRGLLVELGPTFVKFGQVLSSRPDLLPADWIEELRTLQDAVPPFPLEEVRKQIEASLGRPPEDLFRDIDSKPLASASIAQVHKAHLPDGTTVAVKVQRPGIEERVRADLDLLFYLARILEAVVEETGVYTPTGIIEEFERSIGEELDFLNEARNVRRFVEANRKRPDFKIPDVYEALSGRRVLTLEFIAGVKITEACPPHDGPTLARKMVDGAFRQLFEDGFFHGDPHPGNVLVLPDGRIGFLDFGLCGELTPQMRENIVLLVLAVALRDAESAARLIYRVGIPDQRTNLSAFRQDIQAILNRYLGQRIKDVEARSVARDILDLAVRYRIKVPKEYAVLSKAAMTAEGVIRKLDPNLDALAVGLPYAKELLQGRFDPASLLGGTGGMRSLLRIQTFVQDVPLQLSQILMDLEAGKFAVTARSEELPELTRAIRGLGVTIFLGLVAGGCVVGTFIALSEVRWSVWGLPANLVYAIAGAVFATVLWWVALSWSALQGRLRKKVRLSRLLGRGSRAGRGRSG